MRFEVKLNQAICGVLAKSVQEGGQAYLISTEFSSSEDGDHFIERLESLGTIFLDLLPQDSGIIPSLIDNILVVLNKDTTAVVYINEVRMMTTSLMKRPVVAGPISFRDDVAAVVNVKFDGIEVPEDSGVVFLFSLGWRKGLFFDLGPMNSETPTREFDLGETLAWCFERLRLQLVWKLTEADWDKIIAARWFPFVALNYERAKGLIDCIRNDFDLTFITTQINSDLAPVLPAKLEAWRTNCFFRDHMQAIERAVERHQKGDFISSTTLLYLRIEGIMKTYHFGVDNTGRSGQRALYTSATTNLNHPPNVLNTFLTPKFTRFLEEIYYGKADKLNVGPDDVCRNSISHGTADIEQHNIKTSLLGLLILDQLFFYLKPVKDVIPPPESSTGDTPVG